MPAPPATMAMFMLRLAGLLSFDASRANSSTDYPNYSTEVWSSGDDDGAHVDDSFVNGRSGFHTRENLNVVLASPLVAMISKNNTDANSDVQFIKSGSGTTSSKFVGFSPSNESVKSLIKENEEFGPINLDTNKDFANINLSSTLYGNKRSNSTDGPENYDDRNVESSDLVIEDNSLYISPTLAAFSLVSPVPQSRKLHKKIYIESSSIKAPQTTTISNDNNETFDQNQTDSESTTSPKNSIRPVLVDKMEHGRNNPYPYGPLYIPGYSEYSSKIPQQKKPSKTTSIDKHSPAEEYEYEYETVEEKEQILMVQTEQPPVLFHFDGPGYVPEAPSTSATPRRSPTPSDPCNCLPRCPNYTLEDWNPHYDTRRYPQMIWLSTIIVSKNRVLAELEGYMRLQDYFFGLNDRGRILNLSIPFITQIKEGRHPGVLDELNDFAISLHMTPEAAGGYNELPTPISNEAVLIEELEAKTIFVKSFEAEVWEVTDEFLQQKALELMSRLRSNGEAFIDRYYYLASYSRPELYQPVYYEIWIYATSLRNPHPPPPDPLPRPKMPPLSKITQETMHRLCRGVECPSFEVVHTYKYGIQKRRYYDVVFATVSPGDCYFSTLAVWKGFMPLHLYKHGINSHMEVIEATRPLAVIKVSDDSTPDNECPQNLTMSMFLPRRLHAAPPVTGYTAPGPVVITALEDVMVYAYTVGGYLLDPLRVSRELSDLKYRLSEFGVCYRDDVYYIVVYDFIARYHGRQNEIWIVAESCRATKNPRR